MPRIRLSGTGFNHLVVRVEPTRLASRSRKELPQKMNSDLSYAAGFLVFLLFRLRRPVLLSGKFPRPNPMMCGKDCNTAQPELRSLANYSKWHVAFQCACRSRHLNETRS
jgi:hypothetical protein